MIPDERQLRSDLAHELKQPLAVVRGYAELLTVREDERTRLAAAEQILAATADLSTRLDELIDEVVSSRARDRPTSARPDGRRRGVLLVDDDEALRGLLQATFLPDEYDVLHAGSGGEALACLEQNAVDVVVLDWHLPDATGADVLQELRARRPQLPVIVLTAFGGASAASADASAFLTKPFSPVQLLDVVESVVG